jgi:hypothetical protein
VEEASWPHYLMVQTWVLIALILYNSIVALDNHFGSGSMRQSFLGKAPGD